MPNFLNNAFKLLWILFLAFAVALYGRAQFRTIDESHSVASVSPDVASAIRGVDSHAPAAGTSGQVVVLYSNYLCPFCRELWNNIELLIRDDHPSTSMRVYVRHLVAPIADDPAYMAALAAECAGEQGKLREYHRAIFAETERGILTRAVLDRLAAGTVGDTVRFQLCINTDKYRPRIIMAGNEAAQLSVIGTPTLLVGDRLISGTPDAEELRRILNKHGGLAR